MGLMFICEEFVILQMHLITPQHAGKSVAIACGKLVPGETKKEKKTATASWNFWPNFASVQNRLKEDKKIDLVDQ